MSLRRVVPMLILTLWSAARDADGERSDSARPASPPTSAGGFGAGAAGVDLVGGGSGNGGSGGSGCPVGCELCSDENGCLKCEADYSFLLVRKFMSQKGDCVKECPAGYYLDEDTYQRHKIRKCHQCRIKHCEACDQRTYCTRCRPPFLEYRGRCISECARGFHYANYTKDCLPKVDCVVGSWSEWSDCTRDGRTCGFKYGKQRRSLEILQAPTPNGRPCPVVASDERTCSLARRRCPDEQLGKAVAGGGDSRLRPAAVVGNPVSDEPADEPLAARQRWPAKPLSSGSTNSGAGEDVASSKDAAFEVVKPKRPSKPTISCNNKSKSRLPDASVGSEPPAARCHRVRHGQGAHVAQTPAASGERSPSARTQSSPSLPPPAAQRSRSTSPASPKPGAISATKMPAMSTVTFTLPSGSATGERSQSSGGGGGGGNDDTSAATLPLTTFEPTTASTVISSSWAAALVQTAVYEPPHAAAAPSPKVTDVKAAEYYHYYLTSSRQRQRQGSSRAAPAAVSAGSGA